MSDEKRSGQRTPLVLRIKLRYPDVDTFVGKFATNVSRGGMFIASRKPKPVGTSLKFELQLADGSPVIAGKGVVKWVREFDENNPRQPHGMGIEFAQLRDDSEAALARVIELRRERGLDEQSIPHELAPKRAKRKTKSPSGKKKKRSKRKTKSPEQTAAPPPPPNPDPVPGPDPDPDPDPAPDPEADPEADPDPDGPDPIPEPAPDGKLVIESTPRGAAIYLDGTKVGTTPQTVDATDDEHQLALILAGHKLHTESILGAGRVAATLEEVTPPNGRAGIKVRCRKKNRYYVLLDGEDTGQLCPTERLGVSLGEHVVEIYDPVTDTRSKFNAKVEQTRLSLRVRVD
jgi:uncharacterized protein (TIGR02266 family)